MKKNVFILVVLILALISCSQQPKKATSVPLEDFFRNPEKTSYKLSPNGAFFSYMAPYESRMNLFIQKVDADSSIRITSETDRDIAGYLWANNNRLLYLQDTGGDENYQLYGVNIDGSDFKDLTVFEGVRTRIIDELEGNEDEVLIGLNKRDARVFDPYRLNIGTGEMVMLAENPGNIVGWIPDHEGKLRLAVASDGVNQTYLYRDTEDEEFEKVLSLNFRQTMQPLMFTFDNKNIYALSNIGRDKEALVKYDIKNANEIEVLFETDQADVSGVNYSKKDKKLLWVNYYTAKKQVYFLDEDTRLMYNRVDEALPGVEIAFVSENKAEDKFMIRTYSDKTWGSYYFYDKETDDLLKIAEVSPWIEADNMAEMKPISYKSRDGLTIHGYLTLPKGYEPEDLPVVVHPHGGPWARDYWGFNPGVQFLANNGYAVLQMNFRGSTGYGREFWEKSFKQWGQTMQDDITDGVYWLIDQSIADPDRISIYGGSYGGYATLAGLAFTPDLYAAGVDYVGVSNLFTLLKTIPPYWEPQLDMFHAMMGHPVEDSLMMVQVSPVFHADSIKAPLFVAQGANDPRVNINESDQIVEALESRGVDVQYMVKEDEGHGFRNEENRFDFYRAMIMFLDEHLKEE
ncbi:MAG: S9 family peptidase [Prolixibacteraceae bacterium]|jgi:dipeptidyl aminopeptidase/acylaminoacyl peptidase|nr:S9 family peptidase [Prolixibacteraceae bacterium]